MKDSRWGTDTAFICQHEPRELSCVHKHQDAPGAGRSAASPQRSPVCTPSSPVYASGSPVYAPSSAVYASASGPESADASADTSADARGKPSADARGKPSKTKASPQPFQAKSPQYAPASPVYSPSGWDGGREGAKEGGVSGDAKGSPTYAPASPTYTPASPVYAPSSPVYAAGLHVVGEARGDQATRLQGDEARVRAKDEAPAHGATGEVEWDGADLIASDDANLLTHQARGVESDDAASAPALSFAEKMMKKMGYVEGKGLGKAQQGRMQAVHVVDKQDRAGLGVTLRNLHVRQIGQLAGRYQPLGSQLRVLKMEVQVRWMRCPDGGMLSLHELKSKMGVKEVPNMDSLQDPES